MALTVPAAWFSEQVEARPYLGEGAYGPEYGAAVALRARVSGARKLVRNVAGDEVVSEFTLLLPPGSEASVPPESTVTFRGRTARAASVKAHADGYGTPVYVEVTTT